MPSGFHRPRERLAVNIFSKAMFPYFLLTGSQLIGIHGAQADVNQINACHAAGQFTQTKRIETIQKDLKSAGGFLFDCNKGMIWQTQAPITETLIYPKDGTPVRVTQQTETEKLKDKLNLRLGHMLNAILGGDERYLNRYFSKEQMNTKTLFIPKQKTLARHLSSIEVKYAKADKQSFVTLNMSNKDITFLHIHNIQTKQNIEKANICSDLQKAFSLTPSLRPACDILFNKNR